MNSHAVRHGTSSRQSHDGSPVGFSHVGGGQGAHIFMMLRSFLVMVFCLFCHGLTPLKYSLQHAGKKACCLITIAHCGTYNLVNRRTRPGSPEKSPYLCFEAGKERLEKEDLFKQIDAGLPHAGLRDPHRMNLNQVLVKQGWCWWDRKYVPRDTFP